MISPNLSIILDLSSASGLLPAQVASIAQTAPLRYKTFRIPKKNGNTRIVAQPAREVKFLQGLLRDMIEAKLPYHDCIAAYRPGDSIKKNALRHSRSKFLLKMDMTNFFPSITEQDIKLHLEKYLQPSLSADEIDAICHISCRAENRSRPLKLCIGAPSSPWLSNSILFDIDRALDADMSRLSVTYSRYADDLTFSCNEREVLKLVPEIVDRVLAAAAYPCLSINPEKTIHASRATNRTVTGVVITPEGRLSVGRHRKRIARAMHHRFTLGMLNDDEKEQLEGLLNFIESVEPGFRRRLWRQAPNDDGQT